MTTKNHATPRVQPNLLRKNISASVPLTGLGSLITGTIAGGTFNINVNLQQNSSPGKRESTFESSSRKWKQVRVVESSDESQE